MVGFYPCHTMPAYSGYIKTGQEFDVAERVSAEIVNLPIFPDLRQEELDFVIKTIKNL